MKRPLDQDLASVRTGLLDMAGRVEVMIEDVVRAWVERDAVLAGRVIRADLEIDALEKKIDEECITVLALQEPKAIDFRFLVAVQKMVGDLERMGDCTVNMSQAVQQLNDEPPLSPHVDLPRLAQMVQAMVRGSLDALVRKDAALARTVIENDDRVDALYRELFSQFVEHMREDADQVSRAVQLLLLARNLERIGDHATNIAEDVIYYLEAVDIRHPARHDG